MMYNKKHEAMKEEAIEAIIDALESGYSGYYCDLHNEVFNTDYYIVGTHQAKEALKEYDVFEAIELVQEYEEDNFGEVNTELSDPEKLINMVYLLLATRLSAKCATSKLLRRTGAAEPTKKPTQSSSRK